MLRWFVRAGQLIRSRSKRCDLGRSHILPNSSPPCCRSCSITAAQQIVDESSNGFTRDKGSATDAYSS